MFLTEKNFEFFFNFEFILTERIWPVISGVQRFGDAQVQLLICVPSQVMGSTVY